MSINNRLTSILLIFILLGVIFINSIRAQDLFAIQADTSGQNPETIALADISVQSGVVTITTRKMMESIISDEDISKTASLNDSLLNTIDSLLRSERNISLGDKNTRYLNSKQIFWKRVMTRIENEKSKLSGIVHNLDDKKYQLENEITIWSNTRSSLVDKKPGSSVLNRIDNLIAMMDSAKNVIHLKSVRVLEVLDRTTSMGLLINDQIDLINNKLNGQTEAIFSISQAPVWQVNFSNPANLRIAEPVSQFYNLEVMGLKMYFINNVHNIILEVIVLLLLIIVFQIIRRWIIKFEIDQQSFNQRMLLRILLHPISAAFILGIFSIQFIFPDRPLILTDITLIVGIIPLILLVRTITPDKFNRYYYVLAVLMILQHSYYIFPASHLLYYLSMLVIVLLELAALFPLLQNFRKHPFKKPLTNTLIKALILIHIGFGLIGFIALITGAGALAETSLKVTIINAFVGILLTISALIINGLIEVGIASPTFQKLNIFKIHGSYIAHKLTQLINLSAFIIWLFTFMNNLNMDHLFFDRINRLITYEISIGSVSFTLKSIVVFFLVIYLSIVLAKMIRIILEEDVLDKFKLAKGLPHTIAVMVRYTLITIGFLLAVGAAGMPLNSLTIIFGALGIGIGFGLQNIFNNLVSGLILLFERPIQIGDTIEVGDLIGNVKSIGIRSSNVRTFDGAEVIVPNGQLISNEVVNWTLSDQTRRIEVIVGVSYGSDPHKVKALFEKVLAEHPDIQKDPESRVLFNNFGESSLDFRLLFWTYNFDEWLRIRSEVYFSIFDTLKAEGIEIPFPQHDLHLRSVDPNISFMGRQTDAGKK